MHPFRAIHLYICDRAAWEAVCDRCGRCCFEREVDAQGDVAVNYAAPCSFLDLDTHCCTVYERRLATCAECRQLTPATALFGRHLPPQCAYVRCFRGTGKAPNDDAPAQPDGGEPEHPQGPFRAFREKLMLKRLWLLLAGVVAFALSAWAQADPAWTEFVYSRGIYPWLSSAVGFLPSLVGFSVAEWWVAAALLACTAYVGCCVRKLVCGKGERAIIAYRGVAGLLGAAAVLYLLFTLLCGLNYHRFTFAADAGFDVQPSTVAELERLCGTLAETASAQRGEISEDADAYAQEQGGFEHYAQASVEAMETLAGRYDVLARPLYSPPKPVLASELMSDADIAGIYFPFTVESNIDTQGPFFAIPAVMAHELAHQCGFMREDEANFISYLACRESAEPLVRYSGSVRAYSYSINALANVDLEAAQRIAATLDPLVQRDLAQQAQFWAAHRGAIAEMSNAVNNAYLKANHQDDGTRSYGRMVDLLLAEQRAQDAANAS